WLRRRVSGYSSFDVKSRLKSSEALSTTMISYTRGPRASDAMQCSSSGPEFQLTITIEIKAGPGSSSEEPEVTVQEQRRARLGARREVLPGHGFRAQDGLPEPAGGLAPQAPQ